MKRRISFAIGIAIAGALIRPAIGATGVKGLLWLILAKFFASHLDFTVKGIVLILSGAVITVLNVVFIRLRKRRA